MSDVFDDLCGPAELPPNEGKPPTNILVVRPRCCSSLELTVVARMGAELLRHGLHLVEFRDDDGTVTGGLDEIQLVAVEIVTKKYAHAIAVAKALGKDGTEEQFLRAMSRGG
jgi:hypothetical protein